MPANMSQVLEELKDLPPDAQAALVDEFLAMIRSERKWDASFADPRSEALFDRMAAKVRADIAAGRTSEGEPADRDGP
jgi:hypothetical protein